MSESSVSLVIEAGVEPAAVLRVDEIPFSRADVRIGRDGSDFRRAVAWSGLRWPDANLPALVKDQAGGAAVLEDGVVVLVLVELDTPVEQGTVLRVAIIALV